jgi:hypothetical protein
MTRSPTYKELEQRRAMAWKMGTTTLPPEAKVPAPWIDQDGKPSDRLYDYCLPAQYAALSLLPEVRDSAVILFAELGIPWHCGIAGGPGNHLLESQVQCANALTQMVNDPERVLRAFADVLNTAEVLEIEPGRHLTFEYIGDTDLLHEATHGQRVRGAHCTSVDAAFLQRTTAGVVELILLEWKYTEAYLRRRDPQPNKDITRRGRYADLLAAGDGPLNIELLDFDDLLDEPFYQLMRQQLLAHELEKTHASGAERVRVAHVLSAANVDYQRSIHRHGPRTLGATVSEIWQRLLRRPDRFVQLDGSLFLNPQITSDEYVRRYGGQVD